MPVSHRLATTLKTAVVLLVTALVVLLGSAFYLYRLSLTLPEISVDSHSLGTAQTSVVYASDGSVLAEWHGEIDRTVVPLDQIPVELQDAVVAIEDQRFYTHNGVDVRAIARAVLVNAEEGGVSEGGSTITQQLAKILFTEGERTLTRKMREALLAYELEARTDKDTVLETYLNTVYFGHGAYGVESAAEHYFGIRVSDLDLSQCALLAAVIRSPGRYSPIERPEEALARRNLVLTQMEAQGYVSAAQQREAQTEPIELEPPTEIPDVGPYFVEYVKQQLIDRLGSEAVFAGGLQVHTTLDPTAQRRAEEVVDTVLGRDGDPEAALVALDHDTGAIVAMVGGRDYSENQFNIAAQGHRQPGSAFKPFVLVRALEEGVRPDNVFEATPYSVEVDDGIWSVENYENQYPAAEMTLREATNQSVNCVYARLMMQVGAADVVDTATRMGIVTPLEPNPAIALGGLTTGVTPLEMASAYGTIASGGIHAAPTAIERVLDDRGEVVYEPEPDRDRAIDEKVALETSLLLHDVVESGTGTGARIDGVWCAGKTGTTQSYRDAWFVGYAEDLSCAVWVGYREGQIDMVDVNGIKVTGGTLPATIWRSFVGETLARQRSAVTPPSGQGESALSDTEGASGGVGSVEPVLVSICPDSMELANSRCPNAVEMYLDPQLAPTTTCARH